MPCVVNMRCPLARVLQVHICTGRALQVEHMLSAQPAVPADTLRCKHLRTKSSIATTCPQVHHKLHKSLLLYHCNSLIQQKASSRSLFNQPTRRNVLVQFASGELASAASTATLSISEAMGSGTLWATCACMFGGAYLTGLLPLWGSATGNGGEPSSRSAAARFLNVSTARLHPSTHTIVQCPRIPSLPAHRVLRTRHIAHLRGARPPASDPTHPNGLTN